MALRHAGMKKARWYGLASMVNQRKIKGGKLPVSN
jgi:hypothetical protein